MCPRVSYDLVRILRSRLHAMRDDNIEFTQAQRLFAMGLYSLANHLESCERRRARERRHGSVVTAYFQTSVCNDCAGSVPSTAWVPTATV